METARVQEEEKKVVLNEMKEAGNDILTFSEGEERKGGYIFQAYELVYVECYRATLSDGNKATERVLFNSSQNTSVEESLKDCRNIVRIFEHRIEFLIGQLQ